MTSRRSQDICQGAVRPPPSNSLSKLYCTLIARKTGQSVHSQTLPPVRSLPPSLQSPLPLRAPRWSRGDRVRKWRPRDRMGKPGTLGPRSAGESVDVRSSPPWRSWDWGPRGGESTPGRSGELNLCSVFRKGMERVLLLRGDFPSTSMMIPAEMRMPRAE